MSIMNNRKEGWYFIKRWKNSEWIAVEYTHNGWYIEGAYKDENNIYLINETRITTPDEPSVLDRAIAELSKQRLIGINKVINILEKLKSEL